jgi:RHS repeat-associated protein
VWRWDQQEPFGNNPADENPSGLGAFDLPLRLPGQRYDAETGLHYNYFRDYDPSIGRYAESDPIGLRGGLNTYLYVLAEPLHRFDPHGLKTLPDKFKLPKSPQDAAEDAAKRGRPQKCFEQTKGKTHIECKLCCADPRRPTLEKLGEPGTTCRENCDREHGITQIPTTPVCLVVSR